MTLAVGGVAAELGGGDARHGAAGGQAAEGTGGDGGQGGASVLVEASCDPSAHLTATIFLSI